MFRTLMLFVGLILVCAIPAYADTNSGSVQTGVWWGLDAGTTTTFEYNIDGFSIRTWGATGLDDGPPNWQDSFWSVDFGKQVLNQTIYIGWYNLSHTLGVRADGHNGLRVGIRGAYSINTKISIQYDVSLLPSDLSTTPSGTSSGGNGYTWDFGVRYKLSTTTYIQGGDRQWFFNLPQSVGGGSHEWLGPYLEFGITF